MVKMVLIGDQIVNPNNIVSVDLDQGLAKRIWYEGSEKPVDIAAVVPGVAVMSALGPLGFVPIGDEIVNLEKIVSLDIDGPSVVRLWYVGAEAPVKIEPPVLAMAVLNELRAKALM